MSIRPSSIYTCGPNTGTVIDNPVYVIIGNTSLATIYAKKLILALDLTPQIQLPEIYILSSGVDQTSNVNAIESLSYAATNSRLILRDLVSERIHNVLTSSENNNGAANRLYEEYYEYFYGSGPLGDSITNYYNPMIGPWFTYDTGSNISDFITNWTIKYSLKANSTIIMNRLVTFLGLHITSSVIATKPSILNQNFIFVDRKDEKHALERQIFYPTYLESKIPTGVNYINRVNNIYIEDTTSSCYKNVYYSTTNAPNTVPLKDACILWANNFYSYVRILGTSDLSYGKIKVPVFYRYVVAIPKVNLATGLNLNNMEMNENCVGDGITTRLTFTCVDPVPVNKNPPNLSFTGTPTWNISVYTTDEDLGGQFLQGGQYVNPCTDTTRCPCLPNQTLLVVEGTSLTNRRLLSWDELNLSVSALLNSNSIELATYNNFQLICNYVYMAYTGFGLINLGNQSCTTDGICIDMNPADHTFNRESPQTMVLRLISSLFGSATYPTLNNPTNKNCCRQL